MNVAAVQEFADTALQFTELASFTVKRACDELVVHRGLQKKASDLALETLNLLIKSGAVREDQRDAAAAMLGSHAETMQLLKWSVDELHKTRTQKTAGDLGTGVNDTTNDNGEAYDSLNDGVVGRQTSRKKASDAAILRVLEDPRA